MIAPTVEPMLLVPTAPEAAAYVNRYAAAVYIGGGAAPRNGLIQRQTYVGQILEKGRFHVLKPERICSLTEFCSFQLVSLRWHELHELERSLLIDAYNCRVLPLEDPGTDRHNPRYEAAIRLIKAGYLRLAEPGFVEPTPVGEAEIEHRLFNREAGGSLVEAHEGIRVQHHSVQDHEVELSRESTLFVNLDGMRVRIYTLKGSGAVIRIDHDGSHRVYMSHTDEEKHFTQTYVDRVAPASEWLPTPQEEIDER